MDYAKNVLRVTSHNSRFVVHMQFDKLGFSDLF